MIRIFVLAFFALNVLVSCVSHVPSQSYQPVTPSEKIEFSRDRLDGLDVYPDDIRKDLASHTNEAVVWTGIIRSTIACEETTGNKIVADTVFEHHYFNWLQDNGWCGVKLSVSSRGEGLFRARWHLDKTDPDATAENAEKYARPGRLAIVYGVPEEVDTNGTVVLKYRYLRILGGSHFSTNKFDYDRSGATCCTTNAEVKTNAPPMNGH